SENRDQTKRIDTMYPVHRKTDSGLKPRPSGRCEGWNPGLDGRGFDRSYLGGVPTPSKFVHSDRHECLSLISCYLNFATDMPNISTAAS
ncbi:MAG: hypothetical protein LBI87_04600, partial [Candidatus Accumulibacter sp.]|nr:hypothetical protein [Accumulibacter sp.]